MNNELPQRTLTYKGQVTNTDRWDDIPLREDDIFICTPEKCGTTWMQTMMAMMVLRTPDLPTPATVISPWADAEMMPMEMMLPMLEGQEHRRFMKTHTPLDGIPFQTSSPYFVIHRDPRDVYLSVRNHSLNLNKEMLAEQFPGDINDDFVTWVNKPHIPGTQEIFGLEALVNHYLTFRQFADLPNIHLMHYTNMLADPKGTMQMVAGRLDLDIDDTLMDTLVEASSFKQMKANAAKMVPGAGMGIWRDESKFFNKGTSKQWDGVISDENLSIYDARLADLLSPEDAAWFQNGATAG